MNAEEHEYCSCDEEEMCDEHDATCDTSSEEEEFTYSCWDSIICRNILPYQTTRGCDFEAPFGENVRDHKTTGWYHTRL